MHGAIPLSSAKIQRISQGWPVRRQSLVENQSQTKRVESCLVRCLDGGSSPPISTQVESSKGDSIFFDFKAANLHGFS